MFAKTSKLFLKSQIPAKNSKFQNSDQEMIVAHHTAKTYNAFINAWNYDGEPWKLDCDISTQNACEIDQFGDILEEYRKRYSGSYTLGRVVKRAYPGYAKMF